MPNPPINTSQMWADVAELAKASLDAKRSIHDGLWREISELAGLHQETMEQAANRLIDETRELCSLEQRIKEEIRRQLQQMVGHCSCLLDNCQAIIDEHNKKLAKREKNRQAQARRRARQPITSGGELPSGMDVFPAVPSADSLTGLYIPMADGESQLAIDQFQPSMWDANNGEGIFWAGGPTPFTRALVAYYATDGDGVTPVGELTVNVTTDIPDDAFGQLMNELGLAPSSVTVLGQEQAYESAAQVYGQVLVDNLYDSRGMTTYARRPNDLPRLRDVAPPQPNTSILFTVPTIEPRVERLAAIEEQPNVQGPILSRPEQLPNESPEQYRERIILTIEYYIFKGLIRPEERAAYEQQWIRPRRQPDIGDGIAPARRNGELPADRFELPDEERIDVLPDCPLWLSGLLAALGLGCTSNLCDVINAFSRFAGIPQNQIPPCTSLAELAARVKGGR